MNQPSEEVEVPTTREISKVVKSYQERIRNDGRVPGIYRQIQLLAKKCITLGHIVKAMENYLADPFFGRLDERKRPHIRGFMAYENLMRWQNPSTNDSSLVGLHRLTGARHELPHTPTAVYAAAMDDDDEQVFEL